MEENVDGTDPHSGPYNTLYASGVVKRLMLGIQDFRAALRERTEALERGEHTVLNNRGKVIGVLVPITWYREVSEKTGEPTEF